MKALLIKKIVERKMQAATAAACYYPHGGCLAK